MKSVNKVFLLGNVGVEPELKSTPSGQSLATFSLATNRRWKDKSGETREETEWHRVVAWGKLAEIVGSYVKKGTPVHVEGRIQTRQWEDADGQKRYMTEIVADNMTLLGKSDGSKGKQFTESELTVTFPHSDISGTEEDDSLPF